MNDTCAKCGNKLYFSGDDETKLWFYRKLIFKPPFKTFWFDEKIENFLSENIKCREHNLCMTCAIELDKLIEEFLKGDFNDCE